MAGAMVTTNLLQTLVSMGLKALRQRVVLSRIVNRNVEGDINGQRVGSTVNVSIPAAVATRSVSPDVVPPAVTAVPISQARARTRWASSNGSRSPPMRPTGWRSRSKSAFV